MKCVRVLSSEIVPKKVRSFLNSSKILTDFMLARWVMMERIATMSCGSGLQMNIVKFSYKDTIN